MPLGHIDPVFGADEVKEGEEVGDGGIAEAIGLR